MMKIISSASSESLVGHMVDQYAEFAQELPHFLDGIRGVFSLEETGYYVDQLELTSPLSPPQSS